MGDGRELHASGYRNVPTGGGLLLIAHAHARGHVVVTHEVASAAQRKVPIPNVCIGLSVRFINPFEMLRAERVRLILG